MNRCWKCGTKFSGRKGQIFCSDRCRYKYHHSGNLVLTLKKEWFDMILSGEKTEEYRIIKPYWEKRFENYFGKHIDTDVSKSRVAWVWNKNKKTIIFRNGYGNDKPTFYAECTIREDFGKEAWGAEKDVKYYVLTIHRVYGVENINK